MKAGPGSEDKVGGEEGDAGLVLPTPNEMDLFKTLLLRVFLDAHPAAAAWQQPQALRKSAKGGSRVLDSCETDPSIGRSDLQV